MKVSHTAISMWKTCRQQYKQHYLEKLRSEKIPSPFLIGTALDEAFSILLLRKKNITESDRARIEKLRLEIDSVFIPLRNKNADMNNPVDIFDYFFTYKVIKKDIGIENISQSQYTEYFKSDFDYGMLLPEDILDLQLYMVISGYVELLDVSILDKDTPAAIKKEFEKYMSASMQEIGPLSLYESIREVEKDGGKISLTDQCFINYCCWLSLRRKGHLMIKAYEEEILPQIKKVHSIQRFVNLPNNEGDSLIGFIDLEAEFEELGEGVYTIDNKTSSSAYKKEDIHKNGQLLIYDEFTGNGQAAYIVMLKKPKFKTYKQCEKCNFSTEGIKRKCPECKGDLIATSVEPVMSWQIVTDSIDEEKKDLHFQEISAILEEMKEAEYYPQNRDNCFQYGKKCVYYDFCRSGSTKGLVITGKKS